MAAARVRTELEIRRLSKSAQVLLAGSDSLVLVLRGACVVRTSHSQAELVQAGTLLLNAAATTSASDRCVTRALALMCSELGKRWTVESLARKVGLSRAAFAKRFVLAVGLPPHRYLSELRLGLAAELLRSSDASLAELAERVGYGSEFAFSRAFKRKYGVAPSFFRRGVLTPPTTALLLAA